MDINLLLMGIFLAVLPFLFFQLYKINKRLFEITDCSNNTIDEAADELRRRVKAAKNKP